MVRSDVDVLRKFGFNDQQMLQAIVSVGLAQFGNTVAFGLCTVPDFRNQKIKTALRYGTNGAEKGDQVDASHC